LKFSPGASALQLRLEGFFVPGDLRLRKSRKCDKHADSSYKENMNEALSRRISQTQFADPLQEALLSLLVAANTLNDMMDELCEAQGITRPQYNVLRILRGIHPRGHARCEIARRMLDRAPDVTRLVDRLQASGLVKRSRGSDDQRQAVTSITAKGLRLLARMQPEIDAAMGARLRNLNDKDCRELSRLCGIILDPATADQLAASTE
jgi:DNA-binding MarR family transcriptional regulator